MRLLTEPEAAVAVVSEQVHHSLSLLEPLM